MHAHQASTAASRRSARGAREHGALTIACEIVQMSAGDHGPISDQPFSIKNLYFLSNL
jgi:hypothetical protein